MSHQLSRIGAVALGLIVVAGTGCFSSPFDVLGVETIVTEHEDIESTDALEDDSIEDKNPQYDQSLTVVEDFDGCLVTLNKSGSVTQLDVIPMEDDDEDLDGRIFPGRTEAIAEVRGRRSAKLIPSIEVVNGLMKPFNDGIYASVELGVQDGEGGIDFGKRAFLQDLLAAIVETLESASGDQIEHLENAAVFVAGGLLAGGSEVDLPADLLGRAESAVSEFEDTPLFSRPIGFYTWSDDLGEIFRQDRFLQNYQNQLDAYSDAQVGLFAALTVVIGNDSDLLDRYQGILTLFAHMTNPYYHHPVTRLMPFVDGLGSLDDVGAVREAILDEYPLWGELPECDARMALFPSSDSPETELFRNLFCDSAHSAQGVNLIDVLIGAIRDGSVDLAPEEDSGWYDYQLHALEILLLPEVGPESDHLLLTKAYKEKLVETFKSIITQNRETHAKQLDIGMMGDVAMEEEFEVDIYPQFQVEPFPTFYLRSARGYRVLHTALQAILGDQFLESRPRLFLGDELEANLDDELRRMTETLYGLYILSARSVGLRPEFLEEEMAEYDAQACVDRALAFLGGWTEDQEVMSDPRVIVPVEYDTFYGEVIYWAVVGVRVIKARTEFVEGFEPEVVSTSTGDEWGSCTVRDILPQDYYLLVEQMVEVRLNDSVPPPTREELRALCDAHESIDEIVAALEAL